MLDVFPRWVVVVGSAAAGLGTVYLMRQLFQYRDRPGAPWFLASMATQTVWCLSYAVALLTFVRPVRLVLEAVTLVAMPWTSALYLGFALGYTGRGHLLDSWLYRLPLATTALSSLLVVTNPLHGLVWADFGVEGVAGLAGASYTHEPGLFVVLAFATLWTVLGTMLLFDTVVSYGKLFRGEAIAVGLSPIGPGVALLLWLFEAGPVTAINFTPLLFLPHVLLDSYAFIRSDMFEFLPVTRRAGETAAIQDLGTPVAIVDTEGRVVTLNAAASSLVGTSETEALTRPLSALLGVDIDPTAGEQRLSLSVAGERREFAVTPAPLSDTGDTQVGYTLVFQDITEALRREQRLSVMNRVLRHNLRNDLNVVQGYVEASADRVEDPEVESMLSTAARKTTDLARTGQKARDIEETISGTTARTTVEVASLLSTAVADLRERYDGRLDVSADPDLTAQTDPGVLALVVENLVENALEHAGEDPQVTVSAHREDGALVVTVADDGPGIPDHELETVRAGTETDLVHGSGLGLWLVDWGVARLGGEYTVDTEEGTRVRITLPEA